MTYDEEFEHLKGIADQVPEKYRQQLTFMKSQKKDFKGKYWLVSPNYNKDREFTGKVSFIPKKVRVMSHAGNLDIHISCDVIFEDIEVDDNNLLKLLKLLSTDLDNKETIEGISNMFREIPRKEFDKLSRLIGMDKFKLHVNDIIVK